MNWVTKNARQMVPGMPLHNCSQHHIPDLDPFEATSSISVTAMAAGTPH